MKKFELSNDKILCGVCGGIANYFKIDVTLVRAIMTVFLILWKPLIIIYIIVAIIAPKKINDFKPLVTLVVSGSNYK